MQNKGEVAFTETERERQADKTRWSASETRKTEQQAKEAEARILADPAFYGSSIVGLALLCKHLRGEMSEQEFRNRCAAK